MFIVLLAVAVIYDITDRQIELIRSISANNIESGIADNTEGKFQM